MLATYSANQTVRGNVGIDLKGIPKILLVCWKDKGGPSAYS